MMTSREFRASAAHLTYAIVALFFMISTGIAQGATVKPIDPGKYDRPVRVACVGDSITWGAGVRNRKHDTYPLQLGRMLGKDWQVKNFGRNGATLLNNGNNPYMKSPQYARALKFDPDVVVIMLGTNDSKPRNWKHHDDFTRDYHTLIASFQKVNPKAYIYLCLPVPAFSHAYSISNKTIKDQVIPLVKQVATDTDLPTIDLYTAMKGDGKYFHDGIHPDATGSGIMAATIYQTLTGHAAPAKNQPAKAPSH